MGRGATGMATLINLKSDISENDFYQSISMENSCCYQTKQKKNAKEFTSLLLNWDLMEGNFKGHLAKIIGIKKI